MGKSFFAFVLLISSTLAPINLQYFLPYFSLNSEIRFPPATEILEPLLVAKASETPDALPTRVTIPAINLNSPVQKVGINRKGELDVPNGKTNNVGWYKYGTLPGNVGSAVFDAHVYAAFEKLHKVVIGDVIDVTDEKGKTLRFAVMETKVYPYTKVPMEDLVHRDDNRYLNLITCAGKYLWSKRTYDHRLVVRAVLISSGTTA